VLKALALVSVVCVAGLAAAGSRAAVGATGTLSGTTQVSFGCPGPVSPAGPTCHPWHLFPNARFSISRRSTDGTPVPMTAIVVTSHANARFSLRLDAGSYLITPLAQHSTHGGPRLTVHVRAGAVTTVLVRFVGFPQMA
jgi:hypothetical protein